MNILILIHEWPPVGGGGGLIARDLAEGLARRGHRVRVLTSGFGDLPKSEIVNGVEIQRLNVGRREAFRADFRSMGVFVAKAIQAGLFMGKDFKPDLIHAHFAVPAGAAAFALNRLKRIPYVITVHLGDIPGASPEKTGKWFKKIYPFTQAIWGLASKIIAVSQFSRSLAQRSYQMPIDVIPNGIDRTKVKPELPITVHDPVRIVFAGRFVPQKNLIQILRTLNELKDLSWKASLIGDGAEMEEIHAKVQANGLEDRIDLPGWLEPAEVVDRFQKSDILFLPSRAEGLPIVGIQALAAGLALVLSSAGGNPEIVEDGANGYIKAPDDTAGFVDSLRELLTDRNKLASFRNRSYELSERYDIEKVVDDYEAAFESIVAQANARR